MTIHKARGFFALATIAVAVVTLSPQSTHASSATTPRGWMTYVNTKYDFDICYPSLLRAQKPAPAGDGQIFTGPGGGTLTVFWRPGTPGDTLAKTVDGEVSVVGGSTKVIYTAGRANWAVRSGRKADVLFYVKVIQRDDDFLSMNLKYPAANARTWEAMIGHFVACFESSRPR